MPDIGLSLAKEVSSLKENIEKIVGDKAPEG